MSWKPEVRTDTGKWYGNGLRFETKAEAEDSAKSLMSRWLLIHAIRATPSTSSYRRVKYNAARDGLGTEYEVARD